VPGPVTATVHALARGSDGAIGTNACNGDNACANNPGPIAAGTCNGDPDPVTGLGVCEFPAPPPAQCS